MLSAHNEALEDGELTSIRLNRDWREIVGAAVYYYFKHGKSELALDNEDFLDDLMADIYDSESLMARIFTLRNQDIISNHVQASGASSLVPNSTFPHTFTYPNAVIRCYGIGLVGAAGASVCTAIVELAGEATDDRADAVSNGTAARELVAVSKYSGLPTGIAKNVSLRLSATGNSVTINANSILLFEVEEWDD